MDYLDWIPQRIASLRTAKGVSAREMSLALGQSESYINKIENRYTVPSLPGLLYICDYFGLEPAAFFSAEDPAPAESAELTALFRRLDRAQQEHVLALLRDISK